MDIATRLDLFLDVVRQGSYTKAADLRNMDRSSLSKQIKALERELGIRLLNRSTRSIALTEAGNEVLKQAETIRQAISDAHRIVESYQGSPKGLLRITSPTLFGKQYVQKAVKVFLETYPDVQIQLILDNKVLSVIDDRYDIAFRIGVTKDSNLIARKLADNKPVILASKEFVDKHGEPKTFAELKALPAVTFANDGLVLDKIPIVTDEETHILEMHGSYRVNEPELILDAVKSGIGYGVLGQYMLDRHVDDLGLLVLLSQSKLPAYFGGIYALYPHRNPTPLVNKFIETMADVVGDTPVWEGYID